MSIITLSKVNIFSIGNFDFAKKWEKIYGINFQAYKISNSVKNSIIFVGAKQC